MKIAIISQPEYFRFIYEDDLSSLGEVKEFPFNFSMTERDLEAVVGFDADINFFFRGEFVPEIILKKLRGIKVNLSSEPFPNVVDGKLNYTLDSLKRYKQFRTILNKSFDYVFHYDRSSLPFIERDGIDLSGEFYFPVATGVYSKKDSKKKWDFFFVGRSTPHREHFFGALKHHYQFLHICHGIWGEELINYMNQSKILLNVHAENEMSWEPRVQMMMATGSMVISERITKNPYLVPGTDYVEVSSPQEMFDKAKHYLEHEKEREEIAANGMEKVQTLFDSKKIFTMFTSNLRANKYSKVSATQSQSNFVVLELVARFKKIVEFCKRFILSRRR